MDRKQSITTSPHHPAPRVRVACVGDSITYGEGVRDARIDNSYPGVLGRLLGPAWDVLNFGVSGTTLCHNGDSPYVRTAAYRAALAARPDIVVIKLGTNDSKRPRAIAPDAPDNWACRDTYMEDYARLISSFRAANPAMKPFICTPVPAYPGNWGIDDTTLREEVVPRVRTVAIQTGSRLIDLYAALSGRPELFPDTVHPDAAGAAMIATTVHDHLLFAWGHSVKNEGPIR